MVQYGIGNTDPQRGELPGPSPVMACSDIGGQKHGENFSRMKAKDGEKQVHGAFTPDTPVLGGESQVRGRRAKGDVQEIKEARDWAYS